MGREVGGEDVGEVGGRWEGGRSVGRSGGGGLAVILVGSVT